MDPKQLLENRLEETEPCQFEGMWNPARQSIILQKLPEKLEDGRVPAGFNIYRSDSGPTGDFKLVAKTEEGKFAFEDTTISGGQGQQYHYQVRPFAKIKGGIEGKDYEWSQELEEVLIKFKPPTGTKSKDIDCEIKTNSLRLGLKGQDPILDGPLFATVKTAASFWTMDDGEVEVTLQKMKRQECWPHIISGMKALDPAKEEKTKKQMLLERFQEENPGFDFSGAEFSGNLPEDPINFMTNI